MNYLLRHFPAVHLFGTPLSNGMNDHLRHSDQAICYVQGTG
ncbi:hypothetical protein [Spirosoma validum]|nr:hypothetical protein [Spirosoma validum]